eukprot:618211_1
MAGANGCTSKLMRFKSKRRMVVLIELILCLVITFVYIAIAIHFEFLQKSPTLMSLHLDPDAKKANRKPNLEDTSLIPPFAKKANRKPNLEDTSLIPPFAIDVVYTFSGEMVSNEPRMRYNGELRYSLRSIYKYIPWVRAIYIAMSNNTVYPSWIIKNKTSPQHSIPLYIVKHPDIFAKSENAVGNHNSMSIESRLHHIHGLSNHYIYFNDDFFMFRNTSYLFFFNDEGTPRFPSCWSWTHYNNLQNNPILTRPMYSSYLKNQTRADIPLKVPYRMKHIFAEHMPRAYTRSSWFKMEKMYPEWFRFIESHKTRFCVSSLPDAFGCVYEEDMYLLMTSYRILRYHMVKNQTLKNEIVQLDNELFTLLSNNDFKIDIFIKSRAHHEWFMGRKEYNTTNDLKRFTKKLINKVTRPHTFCMNDVFSNESQLYAAEMRHLHRFFRQYLGEPISFERRNFIEPSLRDILEDLDVLKYGHDHVDRSYRRNQTKTHFPFNHLDIPKLIGYKFK